MEEKKLKTILKRHKDWIYDKKNGERANLQDANLQGADLQDANLRYANLQDANLQGADLQDANLRYANLRGANLQDANLRDADLQDANLRGANLQDANLQYANLQGANLRGANLQGANLQYANLQGANLQGANGSWMHYRSNLNILKYQTGNLRAFKYLNGNSSPYQSSVYEVGKTYEVKDVDTDIFNMCGEGINVASLEWCLQDTGFNLEKTYIEVEFDVKDIVCIPFASDGKFRVKKIKVIRKLTKKEIKEEYKLGEQGK